NWTVRITNPGGRQSNSFGFQVAAPVVTPQITSVSPNPVPGTNSLQTITINGNNFLSPPTVFVTWTGGSKTLTSGEVNFVNGNQVQMSLHAAPPVYNWTVRITNPGGRQSNSFGFQVAAPAPTIASMSPNPVPKLNSNQTVTI